MVSAEPSAGYWLKRLQNPFAGSVPTDEPFTLLEVLQVGEGPAWTDWHETILTPGWGWTGGGLFAIGPPDDGQPLTGSTGSCFPFGTVAPGEISGASIDFVFDPLEPGTWVFILKELAWLGGDAASASTCTVDIAESPTVPIPTTVWLLGSGLMGLLYVKRRHKGNKDQSN